MKKRPSGAAVTAPVVLAALGSLALTACPAPITEELVHGARDAVPPVIAVASPAEYAPYSRVIAIDGTVSDLAAAGVPGGVETLTYEILSRTAPKTASVAPDGSFSIAEPNDLRENIVVLLRAVDWNGNEAEYRLPLTFPGNEIPSLSSVEASREVTFSWDPVPGVASYTLYVEPSAKTPDPATSASYAGVSSPFTVTQLKNGSLYSFLLEGVGSDGRRNYSAVRRSVPLSTLHLLPRATSRYDGVELEWRTFASIPAYTVFRAGSPAGPWVDVSGPVAGPGFVDYGAAGGARYYYAIEPASSSSVRSQWIEASADVVSSRLDAPVASYDAVEFPMASAWRDGYVFLADYYDGLRVLDIGSPGLPRQVASVAMTQPKDVVVSGNYLYASGQRYNGSGYDMGVFIVDITAPTAPSVLSFAAVPSSGGLQPEGIAVLGNLVFMAGFNDGFAVIDATNKAAPVVRISNRDAALFRQNYAVAAQERGATDVLVVAGLDYTAVYTVAGTAASPVLTRVSTAMPGSDSVEFSGTVVIASSSTEVTAWQASTPSSPTLLDSVTPLSSAPTGSLTVADGRAFVALGAYGYGVVDVSNPADLRLAMRRPVPGDVKQVSVGGGYAFVSTGRDYPFLIYGANDPSAARLVLTRTDVATGARLAAYRDYLYVSESGSGDWKAASYDISVPGAAFRSDPDIGYYSPFAFAFAGASSYVAGERAGIMQWDATVPGSPDVVQPGYVSTQGGSARSILLSGHYALIGTDNAWLNVVDLSKPGSLTIVAALQAKAASTQSVRSLALRGGFAFLAAGTDGVRVVDVADPAFPVALAGFGRRFGTGSIAALAVSGDYVLAADTVDGLAVFDASNPRAWNSGAGQPAVWNDPANGDAFDVVVRGTYAYVARGAAGLGIWDISDPSAPVAAGTLAASGFSPVALAAYGGHLYALDGATKLYVVDLVP